MVVEPGARVEEKVDAELATETELVVLVLPSELAKVEDISAVDIAVVKA